MKSVKEILKSILLFPKKICVAIKNSYFRSLKGEENFWVVLFGWGVLVYVSSILVGMWLVLKFPVLVKSKTLLKVLVPFIWSVIGSLGLVLIFVYPIILTFLLVRCAHEILYKILAIIILVYFFTLHYALFKLLLSGSIPLLYVSISSNTITSAFGVIFIIALFSYFLLKTILILSNNK